MDRFQAFGMEPDESDSLVQEIMRGRKKKMADGGQVDLEGNSEEDLNNEDQMSFQAGLKEQYDLRQLSKQPSDSNEDGDSRESDSENINDEGDIAQIRRKMKKKARVPFCPSGAPSRKQFVFLFLSFLSFT